MVALLVLNIVGVGLNTYALAEGSSYPVWHAIAWALGVAAVTMLCVTIRRLRRERSNG